MANPYPPQHFMPGEAARPQGSDKNPEKEADHPGGRPTETVKGSARPHAHDPAGQQGTNKPK